LLLDTDHYANGAHVKSFKKAIKQAKQKGVKVALSKPCFELWLLLHHVGIDEINSLGDAGQVGVKLNGILGGYNKTRLKSEHYPPSSVAQAFHRAKDLDQCVSGGDIPSSNTSRVYLIWKAIISSSRSPNIAPEFRGMLDN
jgi:hypothetical protein